MPLKCVCGKSFNRPTDLTRHENHCKVVKKRLEKAQEKYEKRGGFDQLRSTFLKRKKRESMESGRTHRDALDPASEHPSPVAGSSRNASMVSFILFSL